MARRSTCRGPQWRSPVLYGHEAPAATRSRPTPTTRTVSIPTLWSTLSPNEFKALILNIVRRWLCYQIQTQPEPAERKVQCASRVSEGQFLTRTRWFSINPKHSKTAIILPDTDQAEQAERWLHVPCSVFPLNRNSYVGKLLIDEAVWQI